jgi:hypothetical protein
VEAVSGTRPRGPGLLSDPRLLAAGAAGFAAAAGTLWAIRGLPLGTALFWLSPFPLFAAGLGFGPGVAAAAAALVAALLWALSGFAAALAFLALFGAPAALLLAAGLRGAGGTFRPALPLALLGLWPVAVLLLAAFSLSGGEGLQAAMRAMLETTLGRAGFAVPEPVLSQVVRVKAAAIGFLSVVALLCNGFAARRALQRWGVAAVPPLPDPAAMRLPGWYPPLPALAAGIFLAAPPEADAAPLSALLLLLVPLLVMGVAGVHARARGRPGRVPMLALFYVLVALFLQVMGPALVGLGLYDQFRRRAPAPPPV